MAILLMQKAERQQSLPRSLALSMSRARKQLNPLRWTFAVVASRPQTTIPINMEKLEQCLTMLTLLMA
jgi:hypothetical protein